MGTVSARLSEDLEAELKEYLEAERLDRSTAVRKLLAEGLADWRTERALEAFADGEITFMRAAEMADVSVWEFARLVGERDAAWVAADHLEADLDSL